MSAAILKILKFQASGLKSTPQVIPLSLYPFGALARPPPPGPDPLNFNPF